jgi:hypothetical protein
LRYLLAMVGVALYGGVLTWRAACQKAKPLEKLGFDAWKEVPALDVFSQKVVKRAITLKQLRTFVSPSLTRLVDVGANVGIR